MKTEFSIRPTIAVRLPTAMVILAIASTFITPVSGQEDRTLPPIYVPHPSSDDPPPKESLLSNAGTGKGGDNVTTPKAGAADRCNDADNSLGCINQRLGKKAGEVKPLVNLPPLDARSQDIKVGVVNVPAVQQRYGQNFGHSVIPYRPPPPVFAAPLSHR
jgi:hypothetical protein